VTIKIYPTGLLKRYIAAETELDNVHTVADALARLSLPPDMGVIALVNGRVAGPQTVLNDGDELKLAPTISGG